MRDYIKRMRVELDELNNRIAKLDRFLSMDRSQGPQVDGTEIDRMKKQLNYMKGYSAVLSERLQQA